MDNNEQLRYNISNVSNKYGETLSDCAIKGFNNLMNNSDITIRECCHIAPLLIEQLMLQLKLESKDKNNDDNDEQFNQLEGKEELEGKQETSTNTIANTQTKTNMRQCTQTKHGKDSGYEDEGKQSNSTFATGNNGYQGDKNIVLINPNSRNIMTYTLSDDETKYRKENIATFLNYDCNVNLGFKLESCYYGTTLECTNNCKYMAFIEYEINHENHMFNFIFDHFDKKTKKYYGRIKGATPFKNNINNYNVGQESYYWTMNQQLGLIQLRPFISNKSIKVNDQLFEKKQLKMGCGFKLYQNLVILLQ